ncbi:hypothetical protein vseg_017137 [Gypsophila vaccaria]
MIMELKVVAILVITILGLLFSSTLCRLIFIEQHATSYITVVVVVAATTILVTTVAISPPPMADFEPEHKMPFSYETNSSHARIPSLVSRSENNV